MHLRQRLNASRACWRGVIHAESAHLVPSTRIRCLWQLLERITPAELRSLPLGAKTLTLENALRFLKDYLDGDVYYAIARPEHNLDRARTQIRLVSEMERNWEEMIRITEEAAR